MDARIPSLLSADMESVCARCRKRSRTALLMITVCEVSVREVSVCEGCCHEAAERARARRIGINFDEQEDEG